MKTAILFLIAAAIGAAAGAAVAATPAADAVPSVKVAYADLDLSQPKDAAIMLGRIQRAAGEACRQTPGNLGTDSDTLMRLNACYRAAMTRAVNGLGAPQVTEAFAGRAGDAQFARLP